MSDFKDKMHQIQFRLGLCSNPAGGAYSTPLDPLAIFTSKGLRGRKQGVEGSLLHFSADPYSCYQLLPVKVDNGLQWTIAFTRLSSQSTFSFSFDEVLKSCSMSCNCNGQRRILMVHTVVVKKQTFIQLNPKWYWNTVQANNGGLNLIYF